MPLHPHLQRLRDTAQRTLPEPLWQHLQQGAHDAEGSLPSVFDAEALTPRPLRALAHGHTQLQLWQQALAHPILLAPMAYARLFHEVGEGGLAMAATAQGSTAITSSLASQSLAHIADAHRQGLSPDDAHLQQAGASPAASAPWFQLYWQGSRTATEALLQRALHSGAPVVVFTVDAPIKPWSLQLPEGIEAVNLPEPDVDAPDSGHVFDHWMAQAPIWADVHWLRQVCPVPLVIKGLLHPDDALQAQALGLDGIVVSSHGGRVLAGAPSVLTALRAMRQVLAPHMVLLADSGIRSGRDVFVALQAGAQAVLVGRPAVWGLAAQGALGVAQVLRILRDELEMTMALMGCATLADIRAS